RFHLHGLEDHQDVVDLDGLPDLRRDADDDPRDGAAADLALVGGRAGSVSDRSAGSVSDRRRRGDAGHLGPGRRDVGVLRGLRLEDLDLDLVHLASDGDLEFQGALLVCRADRACDAWMVTRPCWDQAEVPTRRICRMCGFLPRKAATAALMTRTSSSLSPSA